MNQRVFGCFAAGAMVLAASSAGAMPIVAGGAGWPTPVAGADAPVAASAIGGPDVLTARAGASSATDAFGNRSVAVTPVRGVVADPDTVVTSFSPTAFAASVPESASWTMLFVGVGMMGFALRRRRNGARAGFGFA